MDICTTYSNLANSSLRITSRANIKIVEASSLSEKKSRDSKGMFLCEGIKLVEEAMQANIKIVTLFISDSFVTVHGSKIPPDFSEITTVISVSDEVLAKISTEKAPQGIIAVCEMLSFHSLNTGDIGTDAKIIILENIQDPGNLGTIIRCARSFGIAKIILCGDCADIYNPKTIRASMGAMFAVGTVRADITSAVGVLHAQKRLVYAAMPHRKAFALGSEILNSHDCTIIGNEGHGLSEEAVSLSDRCIYIPMESGAESLNAASAASVVMWEMYRAHINI